MLREELSDTDNDSAVCDNSPAETTTSDLSQLTTVLQRDIKGKSRLFSRFPPVLIQVLCSEIYSVFLNIKKIISLNKEPVREHRVTIRRGTWGRVNPSGSPQASQTINKEVFESQRGKIILCFYSSLLVIFLMSIFYEKPTTAHC